MSTLVNKIDTVFRSYHWLACAAVALLSFTACERSVPSAPTPRSIAPSVTTSRAAVAVKSKRELAIESLRQAHAAILIGATATPTFRQMLDDANSLFATVPVAGSDEVVSWTRVTLNGNGTKVDAIRFRSPLPVPGNLLYAFAASENLPIQEWEIATRNENLALPSTYDYRNHIKLESVDFPSRNSLVLHHVTNVVIHPETDYYLYFVFSNACAYDTYFKLKVIPESGQAAPSTIHETAKKLDCRLPFQFTPTAKLAERIVDLAEYAGREEALALLEREQQTGATRRSVKFLRACIDYQEASNLSRDERQAESDEYLFAASKQLRELQRTYYFLERDEQDVFQKVLFDEARRLAVSGDTSGAMESLRLALKNGFNKIGRVLAEPDLEALRVLPEFKEFLSQTRVHRDD